MNISGRSMRQSNILLVGGSGYIGSNCPIQGVDKVDLKDGSDFLVMPIDARYTTIIFLAAAAASIEQTVDDYLYNEKLYDRLDKWIAKNPQTHVIFSSSAAIYGESTRPVKESDYAAPMSIYGRSKLAGEFRVREYDRHTVLRFGNVYGRLRGERGHGATEAFQDGGYIIYGDGFQIRDFVPIRLIWKVIDAAITHPVLFRGVTNVGTGRGTTINDWYKRWNKMEPRYELPRAGEINYSVLNNDKMEKRMKSCK